MRNVSIHYLLLVWDLGGEGSRWAGLPFTCHFFLLQQEDTKAFPGQTGDIISPVCPESAKGPHPV